jgi:hypothetical protein
MAVIIRQDEGEPASRPAITGLSDAADALNHDAIWQRLESWIAYRYGERSVEWIVRGAGVFDFPLKPATLDTAEKWTGDDWESVTLKAAPVGYELEAEVYRITATVGTDTVPEAVSEAFTRLTEYLAENARMPETVNSHSMQLGPDMRWENERPATWKAKALHYSGASDLLRAYR